MSFEYTLCKQKRRKGREQMVSFLMYVWGRRRGGGRSEREKKITVNVKGNICKNKKR